MQKSKLQLKIQNHKKTSHLSLLTSNFRGFSLIELLVVVAIIGILSSLLMVNFIGIRQRARDAQRKSALSQIQSALEIYRSDLQSYPQTTSFPTSCPTSGTLLSPDGNTTYMQKVPCDPLEENYEYTASGSPPSKYCLRTCLENISDPNIDKKKYGDDEPVISGCTFIITCDDQKERSFTVENQ